MCVWLFFSSIKCVIIVKEEPHLNQNAKACENINIFQLHTHTHEHTSTHTLISTVTDCKQKIAIAAGANKTHKIKTQLEIWLERKRKGKAQLKRLINGVERHTSSVELVADGKRQTSMASRQIERERAREKREK